MSSLGVNVQPGLPVSVTGNVSSLKSLMPETSMSVGPFANVGLTELGHFFPWMDKAVNTATGGYPSTNFLDTVIPNSGLRDVFNALNADQRNTAVHNATVSAIVSATYHGLLDTNYAKLPPAQQQAILDRIENNAKTNLLYQALLSFFTPLSPTVNNYDYDKNMLSLRDEYLNLQTADIKQYGNAKGIAAAQQKFMEEHGSDSVSYTIGFSKTQENGASVPLSDTTVKWLNNNADIMKSNPNGAAYLIPQNTTGGNVAEIENKLLAMHVRSKETPADIMNAIYVQKGWSDLGNVFNLYQNGLAQAKAQQNTAAITVLSNAWKQVSSDYAKSNPIWWNSYKDPTKATDAYNALSDLQALNTKGKLSVSPQGADIKGILALYDEYHQAILQNTVNGKLNSTGYTIVDAWDAALNAAVQANPALTNVVNGVFRRVQ
jgi:hypothetical protein